MQIIPEVERRQAAKVKRAGGVFDAEGERGFDKSLVKLDALRIWKDTRNPAAFDLRDLGMIRVLGAPRRSVISSQTSRMHSAPLACDVVSHASIPLAVRCRIETYDPADDQTFRGWKAGVYDQSKTICDLSLTDRHWTRLTDPFKAKEIHPDEYTRLPGDVVYGGLLLHHFGHFLLESTARLWWPLRSGFKGPIVLQNTEAEKPLPGFAVEFFDLLGLSAQIVVATGALKADRVIVPERSFVMKKRVHADFRLPFRRAGDAAEALDLPPQAEPESAGLYLSRTRFPTRRSIGEKRLERAFAENGFTIAHLEALPLRQQIRLVRRHQTIAGLCGSALHNILFCSSGRRTINVCRDWDINANFFMIDELMHNESTYIYGYAHADADDDLSLRETFAKYWDDVKLDVPKIRGYLRESGIA